MLKPFTGDLNTPDHLAWIEEGRQLHKAYRSRRRAWLKQAQWPWPSRRADDRKPEPLTGDWDSTEEG